MCASEVNGLINVQSDYKEIQHKVCASEVYGLSNVQSYDKETQDIKCVHQKLMD